MDHSWATHGSFLDHSWIIQDSHGSFMTIHGLIRTIHGAFMEHSWIIQDHSWIIHDHAGSFLDHSCIFHGSFKIIHGPFMDHSGPFMDHSGPFMDQSTPCARSILRHTVHHVHDHAAIHTIHAFIPSIDLFTCCSLHRSLSLITASHFDRSALLFFSV